jgi:hypothetical protein
MEWSLPKNALVQIEAGSLEFSLRLRWQAFEQPQAKLQL